MRIFLISISGKERVPKSTLSLLEKNKQLATTTVGIDMRERSIEEINNTYKLDLAGFITGGLISSGELGCLLSHQQIYRSMINENIPSAIVLEDDAMLNTTTDEFETIVRQCEQSEFDLVNLHTDLGGLLLGRKNSPLLRAFVPPLSAFSYWITLKGAKVLSAESACPLGLADWPPQINKLHVGGVAKNLFEHSGNANSVIAPTLSSQAETRINMSYRPISHFLNRRAIAYLCILIGRIGFWATFKALVSNRTYRRLAKVLFTKTRGSNRTIKIQF